MILKNFLLAIVFLLLSAVPAEAQKTSETPQKREVIAGNMMMLGRDLCGFMHYDDIASTDFLATLPTEEMHEVWKSQGADDKLDTEIWDIPHSCHKDVQLKMLHFLDEYLK